MALPEFQEYQRHKRHEIQVLGNTSFTVFLTNRKASFTHVTRLSWQFGILVSIGFFPVISSRRTTPNENTSVFSLTLPYKKYSGARYLWN
jgi:hypothetical protein